MFFILYLTSVFLLNCQLFIGLLASKRKHDLFLWSNPVFTLSLSNSQRKAHHTATSWTSGENLPAWAERIVNINQHRVSWKINLHVGKRRIFIWYQDISIYSVFTLKDDLWSVKTIADNCYKSKRWERYFMFLWILYAMLWIWLHNSIEYKQSCFHMH